MRTVVLVLTLVGPALTTLGAVLAFLRVRRELRGRRDLRRRALEVDTEHGTDDERAAARQRREAILAPSSTYNDVFYLREVIAELILEAGGKPLVFPAILAGLGLACSTTASALVPAPAEPLISPAQPLWHCFPHTSRHGF